MTEEQLVALARAAALRAYAPYSGFHVGCAVESTEGEVITGVNMENACYRLGVCAEQSALAAAQQGFGLGKVSRVAVSGGSICGGCLTGATICTPCGGCRQAMFEAAQIGGREIAIICASGDGASIQSFSPAELLPLGFGMKI